MGSDRANRQSKKTFVAVIAGLVIFVIDVFAFNGEGFTYLLAAVVTASVLAKWLLAWYPLRIDDRIVLFGLAAVPWAVAYADPYAGLRAAAVANITWLGLAIVVLRRIDGRSAEKKR